MPDDFPDFEDIIIPTRARPLPDQMVLLGENSDIMRAMLIDSDHRLAIVAASPVHYARLPVLVPTGAAGQLEEHPDDGVRTVFEINVVNVNAAARTLTLYLNDEPPSSTKIIAANAVTVAGNSAWQWQGVITLETKDIWGIASAANSLYAFFSVRDEVTEIR